MVPLRHLPDVLIVGAGVIGLSLALELRRRNARVTVLERGMAMAGASIAAAGMLAAEDPHNPPALRELARYSLSLYPEFLASLESLSGLAVPLQTSATVQYLPDGTTTTLAEHSIDPRQLAPALLAAARSASVRILEHTSIDAFACTDAGVETRTITGEYLHASHLVHASGAWTPVGGPWARSGGRLKIFPCKGQMLRVTMPAAGALRQVHRAEHVYVVPRTTGPDAGTALIGATVEDAGFDLSTNRVQLDQLRIQAAALCPATAFSASAPGVEAWAGLRPSTVDGLPLLGSAGPQQAREWLTLGHLRNGSLLAPATAHVLADLLAGRDPAVSISPFDPARTLEPRPASDVATSEVASS